MTAPAQTPSHGRPTVFFDASTIGSERITLVKSVAGYARLRRLHVGHDHARPIKSGQRAAEYLNRLRLTVT